MTPPPPTHTHTPPHTQKKQANQDLRNAEALKLTLERKTEELKQVTFRQQNMEVQIDSLKKTVKEDADLRKRLEHGTAGSRCCFSVAF